MDLRNINLIKAEIIRTVSPAETVIMYCSIVTSTPFVHGINVTQLPKHTRYLLSNFSVYYIGNEMSIKKKADKFMQYHTINYPCTHF